MKARVMLNAFLSPASDDLFSSIAAFADARELSNFDVIEGQRAARLAIKSAIGSALRHKADPSSRLALIKGDAGSGKSHVLTTSFRAAASLSTGEVYPIVLQLTAPVTPEQYETWLIDATVRQLSARHFADEANHSPLRRLAGKLLEKMPLPDQDEYLRLIDDLDNDGEIPLSLDFAERLRRMASDMLAEAPPVAAFIAIVMLAGYGDPSALNYLRYGETDERIRVLKLPPVQTAHQRMDVLRYLGLTAQMVGASLAMGFDQVENTIRLGSEALFVHALMQAVRIAESVVNCAVIIVVLGGEYDNVASGERAELGLAESDRDRIEREPPIAVALDPGTAQFRKDVIAKRLGILRQRAKITERVNDLDPLPLWFIPRIEAARNVRIALREVALFRERAVELGRLPTQVEYDGDQERQPNASAELAIDFDKEWADFLDTAPTVTRKLLDTTKAALIAWWATEASREHVGSDVAEVNSRSIDDEFSTPVIDVAVKLGSTPVALRHLALCDAPNRNQKLRNQIERVLEVSNGIPVLLRTNGFPKGPTSQVAGSLKRLRALSGFILDLGPTEWHNLQRAKEFSEQMEAADGFLNWRRDRQWLLQFVSPLQPLIALPDIALSDRAAAEEERLPPQNGDRSRAKAAPEPRVSGTDETHDAPAAHEGTLNGSPFPVFIGTSFGGEPVHWSPYREVPNHLNNFSLLVTGDAGTGKTQTIRVLIDAAAKQDLSVVIFDFKADYCDPSFAEPLGLEVIDVRKTGLPFNPMQPPPREASGIQPVEHAYELAGILSRVFRLGDVQTGKLKDGICAAYEQAGIKPREWIDPSTVTWPPFEAALDAISEEKGVAGLLTRLRPLCELGLFPSATSSEGPSFADFVDKRICLKLSDLPSDDVKSALAEIIIVQVHGYALRGEQPRRLKRLMVFDEAHRVKDSQRLESLAREGRAFGVGIVIGTQFPGDIHATLAGNLATQLFLMNNQVAHRKIVVGQLLGSTSGTEAHALLDKVGALKPLEGIFSNAHYNTGVFVRILPHYQRPS